MNPSLLSLLRCPNEESPLALEALEMVGTDVLDGLLRCSSCSAAHWIVRGIPRFVSPTLFDCRDFVSKYSSRLQLARYEGSQLSDPGPRLEEHQVQTTVHFGREWQLWSRYGWDDPSAAVGPPENVVFSRKTLVPASDFHDSLVLDAGCGNGKFSFLAAKSGAKAVVGVDLSNAVEVAYENVRSCPAVHIVQADIFNLPLPHRAFDVVFSIGVLHHTGNTRGGLASLLNYLRLGGTLSVELYQRGNLIYELLDRALRRVTTRLSDKHLWILSRALERIANPLHRLRLLDLVNIFIRLGPNAHIIYDWYGPPIATHHTFSQVEGWFAELGMDVVSTSKKDQDPFSAFIRRHIYPTEGLTVRGRLPDTV